MFQNGTIQKLIILIIHSCFIVSSQAATICVDHFKSTFISKKLTWTESEKIINTTIFPITNRWNNRPFLLKLSNGSKVSGEIKTHPYVYDEPTIQSGRAHSAKSEFIFTVSSNEQAQAVANELHFRHKLWLEEGKRLGKIYQGRQDLPAPGPDQMIRFKFIENKVHVWFEYSGEPSISATISQEFIKALLFTGVTIDIEILRPRNLIQFRFEPSLKD